MLIFLVPTVMGSLTILLLSIGSKLKTGREGTKFESWCFNYSTALGLSSFLSFAMFIVLLIGITISHVDYAVFPAKYEAVTMTLAESRSAGASDIERAAILHKIVSINEKIASARYWNDSIWVEWFIPDKIVKLEFIK